MSAERLYTPEVLDAAMRLARYPLTDDLQRRGTARSRSCGSHIELGLALDGSGRIAALGMKVHACAIGQASAAVFAQGATGRDAEGLARSRAALLSWLAGEGPLPDWPGLSIIAPAREYPGRHGAIRLGWDAALSALADGAEAQDGG